MKILLSLLLIPTAIMCFCCGGCPASREEVKKRIDKADVLWDSGKKTDAVMEYRLVYEDSLTDEKGKILPRVVEFEVNVGNLDEAKKWIKRGLDDKLNVEYKDAVTKELFATVKKERDEAAAEEVRRKQEKTAEAERKAAERAEAERKRQNEPNPEYLKVQEKLEAAKIAFFAAKAKVPKPIPGPPPLSDLEELKGMRFDVVTKNDFVPVYSNATIERPYFTLREDATADILDVSGRGGRGQVVFTSGRHKGDKGWVRQSDLPEKVEKAIARYEKTVRDLRAAGLARSQMQATVTEAKRRVDEAETTLRNTPATVGEAEVAAAVLAEKKTKEAQEARKAEAARRYAEEHRVSRANYDKIKSGMSLADVQAILGPGKENARGEGFLIATWQSKAGFLEMPTIISITFQNGRVESKAIAP